MPFFLFLGWTIWISIWTLGVSHSGSAKRVAHVKTSQPSFVQAPLHHPRPFLRRSSTLGRQLRPSIRFRFRFPSLLRLLTVHIFWQIRQTQKDIFNMGMSGRRVDPIYLSGALVLYHTRLRLQSLFLL